MNERALIEIGERVRNARIRDWIEQSPQPKLCEKHKAWSSTSSDYDTAHSDLSASGTWDLLSVSMRSINDFEQKQREAKQRAERAVTDNTGSESGRAYQHLSQRYHAPTPIVPSNVSSNVHTNAGQDVGGSRDIRMDNARAPRTKENGLVNARPPLYQHQQTGPTDWWRKSNDARCISNHTMVQGRGTAEARDQRALSRGALTGNAPSQEHESKELSKNATPASPRRPSVARILDLQAQDSPEGVNSCQEVLWGGYNS